MKVERTQPGFSPVGRRFTQVDSGRRIGATAELAHRDPDENHRKKFDDDDDDDDAPSLAQRGAQGGETRLLNITA
jgi:hypothetical protein